MFAVVSWYNYRKELNAQFLKGFDYFEDARKYAYECALKDKDEYENDGPVITEDEITDINGPGKTGSPYANKTIVGYGGRDSRGYSTMFYCVVKWFQGVENEWDSMEDSNYWKQKYGDEWYPEYYY
jgi:hypothetical protein